MLHVRPLIAKGSVLLLGLLAPLLLFEGLLRLTTAPTLGSPTPSCDEGTYNMFGLVFDPVFGWRNEPGSWSDRCGSRHVAGALDVVVNQLGFRGPEIERKKKRGVIRIVSLGDSGTFGVQAAHPDGDSSAVVWRAIENYPNELVRRLAREGFDQVEVINAGVIGYGSSQVLRTLALRIMELEPDIVTARFAANDAARSWAPERRTIEPGNPLVRSLLYRLYDWRVMRLALRAYQSVPGVHPKPDSVLWTTPEQFRTNVERIVAVTKEEGVPLLLIDYPLGELDWLENPAVTHPVLVGIATKLPNLRRIVRDVAKEAGVPVLETAQRMIGPEGRFFDRADLVHPNPRGARRIGQLLFEKLRALGWLEATADPVRAVAPGFSGQIPSS